jgi:hypothetical protein
MTTPRDTPIGMLAEDFARVCGELEHARLLRDHKDSTEHRAAVRECEGWTDAVLDLFLLLRRPPLGGLELPSAVAAAGHATVS